MSLTKRTVDALAYDPHGPQQQILYDGTIAGLGVRIYPTGRKSYVVRYRTRTRRERLHTIGSANVLTVAEARKRARSLLVAVADGGDPQAERTKARAGLTVADFARLYIEQYARPKKRAWPEDQRRIDTRIIPALGSRHLVDVTRGDVEALHVRVGAKTPTEANRLLTLIGRMYQLAEDWGHTPEGFRNPARGIRRFPESSRRRFASREELGRLFGALNQEPSPYVRGLVLLLLLTGARKRELLRARWADVDWDGRRLRLPQTKTGRDQVLLLSPPALALLRTIPRQAENEYIFPSERGTNRPLFDIQKPWAEIRKRAKLPDLTIHDLRRSVGSHMAERGEGQAVIGEVLRQSSPTVTSIYTRIGEDAATQAVDRHGEWMAELAGEILPED